MAEMRVSASLCRQCWPYFAPPSRCSPGPTRRAQARIVLLKGECRSFDNVKLDLMRRIKMLEYALRVERYEATDSSPQHEPESDVSWLQLKAARPARSTVRPAHEACHAAVPSGPPLTER